MKLNSSRNGESTDAGSGCRSGWDEAVNMLHYIMYHHNHIAFPRHPTLLVWFAHVCPYFWSPVEVVGLACARALARAGREVVLCDLSGAVGTGSKWVTSFPAPPAP